MKKLAQQDVNIMAKKENKSPIIIVEYLVGVDILGFPIVIQHKVPNFEYHKKLNDERSKRGISK